MTYHLGVFQRNLVHWSPHEDQALVNHVSEYGLKKWGIAALKTNGKNEKQCRERYKYNLNPNIQVGPWSKEEDALILKLRLNGSKWSEIEQIFHSMNYFRNDHQIKLRFRAIERQRKSIGLTRYNVSTKKKPKATKKRNVEESNYDGFRDSEYKVYISKYPNETNDISELREVDTSNVTNCLQEVNMNLMNEPICTLDTIEYTGMEEEHRIQDTVTHGSSSSDSTIQMISTGTSDNDNYRSLMFESICDNIDNHAYQAMPFFTNISTDHFDENLNHNLNNSNEVLSTSVGDSVASAVSTNTGTTMKSSETTVETKNMGHLYKKLKTQEAFQNKYLSRIKPTTDTNIEDFYALGTFTCSSFERQVEKEQQLEEHKFEPKSAAAEHTVNNNTNKFQPSAVSFNITDRNYVMDSNNNNNLFPGNISSQIVKPVIDNVSHEKIGPKYEHFKKLASIRHPFQRKVSSTPPPHDGLLGPPAGSNAVVKTMPLKPIPLPVVFKQVSSILDHYSEDTTMNTIGTFPYDDFVTEVKNEIKTTSNSKGKGTKRTTHGVSGSAST